MTKFLIRILVCVGLAVAVPALPALAESQGVVAVVNDLPITERDIDQRIKLMKTFGDEQTDVSRKGALKSLIDEEIKIIEINKYKMAPSDIEINKQVERLAKGLKLSSEALVAKLKKDGISEDAFRRYVSTSIGFNRIISGKYRNDLDVDPKTVDAKFEEIKKDYTQRYEKIMNDPRMKPVTVVTLREVSLPVDASDPMLLQSRALEAAELAKRIKGCGSIKSAAAGIFNVKPGKQIEADSSKLPKELRAALDRAGEGRAIGPMRGKDGLQLLVYCGSRKLAPEPPKYLPPSRQQVENLVLNEKYQKFEDDYMKTARTSVYIEYRDASYSQ